MKVIYISAPYTPSGLMHYAPRDAFRNVKRAMTVAVKLIKLGFVPICPHLSHFMHVHVEEELSYDEWMEYDLKLLELCDAVLCLGNSPGVKRELEYAKQLGLKVFYSLEELLEEVRK